MGGDFTKRAVWLVCLMLVLSTTFALGQGIVTGSIAGTVVDPQKAVVPGAKVAARNVATNVDYKTTTNDQGYFSIRSIPTGTYAVSVQAPNFKRLDVGGVIVNTGVITDMGALALALGATAETITVEAAAPLVDTTSAQGGATFSGSTTQALPLFGGIDAAVLFTPGVQSAGNAGIFAQSNGASFGINGQRDRSNNFQIDGQYNNDPGVTGPAIKFTNQDTLQEVQVVTNNFGVEYGRNSGGTINYVTKSGTNNFHGSAFEYFAGNWSESLTHLEKPADGGSGIVPRFVDNRWGGTLGGPIVPNKIFFFLSYLQETQKGSSSPSVSSLLTPTPAGLATLSACPSLAGNPALAVLKAVSPFAVAQGNPAVFPVAPTPGVPSGPQTIAGCPGVDLEGVTRTLPAIFNDYEATGRVDFALSPRDNLFVRYLFTQPVSAGFNGALAQFSTIPEDGTQDVFARNQQAAVDWTRNWTSHLVNQVRFSFVREFSGEQNGNFIGCTPAAINACPPFIRMENGAMPFGLGVNLPQAGLTNNSQWQDNASWQHGRHLIKFGGEYDRIRAPNVFLPQTNGQYFFAGADAVGAWDAFFSQSPSQVSLTNGNSTVPFKEQDVNLYLGDDWRIKDNLTLNLGVRWEFQQQAINLLVAEDLQRQLNPATAFWNTSLPLSQTTLPQVQNRYDHFAPNIGFAWTPHMLKGLLGENKTVIRGGFRMAYDPSFYNIFLNVATAAPSAISAAFACPAPCPIESTGAGLKAALAGFVPTGGNPATAAQTRVSPNFTNPYAEEWTLGIQREISGKLAAEVRYVGTHTVHEFQTVNGNPQLLCGVSGTVSGGDCVGGLFADFPGVVPAGVTPCSTPGAPGFNLGYANCNNTLLRVRNNGSTASYHSLQSQLKFQNWHGLTAVAAYTFSKNLDNASEIFSIYGPSPVAGPQDPFCTKACERGLSALDYPHNFTLFWQYQLPFGQGRSGVLSRLLGGWALGGDYRYNSGQVWSPFEDPGTNSDCNDGFNGHFFGASSCRPFPGNFAAPVTAVGQCIDAAAPGCGLVFFGTATPTTASAVHWIVNDDVSAKFFGTPFSPMRRDPGVRGQTVNTVNLNLIKNNRISERVNLRLEADVYNLLNHTFLGVPCADITSDPCFGSLALNDSGGVNFDSGVGVAGGSGGLNTVATGLAQRQIVLGAHIIF
jgi:hypothetical protein